MATRYDLDVLCGMYGMSVDRWADCVYAYHLTPTASVASIKSDGLRAARCKGTLFGEHRTSAVYLFARKSDAYDDNVRKFLFGNQDVRVFKVRIPRAEFGRLHEDGLFNMSCIRMDGGCPTGMQYTGDIPARWIV